MAQNDNSNNKSKSRKDSFMNAVSIDLEDLKERNTKEKIKMFNKEGITSIEYAKIIGISQRTAQRKIKKMIEEGTAYLSGYMTFKKTDGTVGHSPLYRIDD